MEFAKSDEKELVFPVGLSAGERNAACSLAAAKGLGQESKGDEGRRALHVWKVRNVYVGPIYFEKFYFCMAGLRFKERQELTHFFCKYFVK